MEYIETIHINIDDIQDTQVVVSRCWVFDVELPARLIAAGKSVTVEASLGDLFLLPKNILGQITIIYDIDTTAIIRDVRKLRPGDIIRIAEIEYTLPEYI